MVRPINFRRPALTLISPVVFMLTIWAAQFFLHTFFDTGIASPSVNTWTVVGIGLIAFAAGAMVVSIFPIKESKLLRPQKDFSRSAAALVSVSTPVAIISAAVLISQTGGLDQGFEIFNTLKLSLIEESLSGFKSSILFVYIIIFNSICVLYYCNTINFMENKKSKLLVLVTAFLCIFSGSRALLIFFLISLFPALIFSQKRLNIKFVSLVFLGFAMLFIFFFSYPVLFQSFDAEFYSEDVWKKYLSVYLLSGISAFSKYLANGEPSYNCILLIPRSVKLIFDSIFLTNTVDDCPVIFDVTNVSSITFTNVYSIFFQAMHDSGIIGVALYLAFVGYAANLSYRRGIIYGSNNWRFLYCLFFFTIFMTFFEDQFSRAFIYYFFSILVIFIVWLIKKIRIFLVKI